TGTNAAILCVGIDPEIGIYIGGHFTDVDGVELWRLARLTFDGSVDMSFYGGVSTVKHGSNTALVAALAIQPDHKIVIGGTFEWVVVGRRHNNWHSEPSLARLHFDGNLDMTFGYHPGVAGEPDGAGFNGGVGAIALMGNGKIVFTGAFEGLNG